MRISLGKFAVELTASSGDKPMPTVDLSWDQNPLEEQIEKYNVYQNNTPVGNVVPTPADPTVRMAVPNVNPGAHTFTVEPVNPWGPGPASDPIKTPPAASKPKNLTFRITVG